MKHSTDGAGQDSTAALLTYLASRQPLYTAELYQLRAPRSADTPFSAPILLTDYAGPLIWSVVGKFAPAVIRHSPIETTIGLDAQELTVDWAVGDQTMIYAADGAVPLESYYDAFREGLFDHGVLRVWRAWMPVAGDANRFGCTMLFQGRIGNVETDALGVHLSVQSVMEVLNRKLPPNLIESANINAAWLKSNPVTMVIQPSSTVQILLTQVQGDPSQTFPAGYFRYGHVYFPPPAGPGQLAGHYRQIQDSFVTADGLNAIQLMEPLPFPPNVNTALGLTTGGELVQAFPPHPEDLGANDSSQPGYPQVLGFRFIPRPEDSL